jgi:hypothetical protein
MVFGHEVPHRRRKQQRLIDLPHTECLAHAAKRIRLALLWPAKSV